MKINRTLLIWLFPAYLIIDFALSPVKTYWVLVPLVAFLILILLQRFLTDKRWIKPLQWGFMAIVLGYVIFTMLLPASYRA
jgi:4-amino-4-deoxy-L-arabinose transferase-like glycosyltransferase